MQWLGGDESGRRETAHGKSGVAVARIEVGPAELPRLRDSQTGARVAEALQRIGYAGVALDLQGHRRGSLNAGNGAAVASAVVSDATAG